ncbi:GGDEF domain-containing protein [Halieaceae bacterium IMCC14734]|uniref:diguanylate cyclase n=1 Tax=Candidatus Litorirhabdus singularis TaxID=2518993 RepID=A0ABT3TM53_9GAMM|nr:GGDEF domain-containing protein [Candidatus Litorirhabdus singularis]MCX2982820.1 GGDEF domain-containing protein [Candidatus Litorirhabdus singularis]
MTTEFLKDTSTSVNSAEDVPSMSDRSLEMSIIFWISSVTIVVISGFAVYRWQTDDSGGAAVNTLIVSMVAMVLMLSRYPRHSALAIKLFGLTTCSAALLSSLLVSNNGLLWALLVLLVNTLTQTRRWALALNAVVIVVLTAATQLYESLLQQVSWTTVAILITSFAQLSTDQLRKQRELLAKQANIDPLTGAGNRRLMQKHLQDLATGRRSGERSATLMVFDLDNFKEVNDQHGHETGDRVLIEFVRSVHSSQRGDDGFYRMGGEEFVMLLRGMNETTARAYLPGLHQRLSGQVKTPSGAVEFSSGAATLRQGEDWSNWLARADRALYTAKNSGRNQILFCED